MDAQSTLLLVEPIVFGRAAMGKPWGSVTSKTGSKSSAMVAHYSRFHGVGGDAATHLARPNIAGGAGAMASVIYVSADAETHLQVRAILPTHPARA
jgi:urease accessory protein